MDEELVEIVSSEPPPRPEYGRDQIVGVVTSLGQGFTDDEKKQGRDNIEAVSSEDFKTHTEDTDIHITSDERTYWNGKQDALTWDTIPTEKSVNPVTSQGIKSYVDSAVSGLYKYRGSVNPTYINSLEKPLNGDVYNISENGEITIGEGGNKMYVKSGDNIAWVDDPITKTSYWDRMAAELDLSNFVEFDDIANATTTGVVKSSDTDGKVAVDEDGIMSVNGFSNKADKVKNATKDNLASLDANGNLADSGKSKNDIHTHSNKTLLDSYDQTNDNIKDAVDKKHSHTNKTVLDGITSEKVTSWDNAATNSHTHSNKEELDKIESGDKAKWDAMYTKPSTGIPKTDLANDVQTSLGLADTALQSHQSLDGYVNGIEADTTTTFSDNTTIVVTKNGNNLITRLASQLWTYIKNKMSNDSNASIGGNAASSSMFKTTQVLSGESNELPTAKVGKNWSKIAKIEGGNSNIGLLDIRLTSCSYGDGGNTLFGNVLYSSNSKKITIENRNADTTALTDFAIVRILDSETKKYTIEFWLRIKNAHKNALFTVNRFYSYNGTRTICASRGTEHNVYNDTEFASYLDGKDCVSSATDFVPAIDSNVVHKTDNETIKGNKSFSDSTTFNNWINTQNFCIDAGCAAYFRRVKGSAQGCDLLKSSDRTGTDQHDIRLPSSSGTLALTTDIPDISVKQDKLVAGSNITIDDDGKTISATNTEYEEVSEDDIKLIVDNLT